MSAIFALANQKGGVAKTTTTGTLAAGLKKQGFSVLTIDCDPQGNLSMSVAAENQELASQIDAMNAEADKLIDELLELKNPYACPHGRPTIISMSKYELEKKFKRIV